MLSTILDLLPFCPARLAFAGVACFLLAGTACDRGPGETHPGPAFISGTVFGDLNGDGVQNNGEKGLGGILIHAEEAGSDGGGFSNSATTDGNGRYSIELVGSLYRVFVDPADLAEVYVLTSKPEAYELFLPDGREESLLDFGLQHR